MPTFVARLMADDLDRVRDVAPRHAAYWHDLSLPGYLGGPFGDRSGGLILIDADNRERAEQLVRDDPFVHEGLLRSWRLEQWLPKGSTGTPPL